MTFSTLFHKASVRFLCLFLLICAVYHHTVFRVIEDPDAYMILKYLQEVTNLSAYFHKLWNYELLDFQPIRDLTLYLDMKATELIGMPTYTFQNLLWWVGCGYVIENILNNLFPRSSLSSRYLSVVLFCLYPLFSNILPWGMARKHLLSFFFTACATAVVTSKEFKPNLKKIISLALLYALAVLSQPINLLFPFWILIYVVWLRGFGVVNSLKTFFPLGIIFVTVARLNYYYYETSKTFKYYYPSKTEPDNEIGDRILALGYYFYELFFPYSFTMYPSLGSPRVFAGLVLFISSLYLSVKWVGARPTVLWFTYMLLPLSIVLVSPKIIFDYYLLTPALGCLLLVFLINAHRKIPLSLVCVLGAFFSLYSYTEAGHWNNPQNLMRVSFERQPNCINAYTSIRLNYEVEKKASPEAKNFLETHDCDLGHGKTGYDVLTELSFLSNLLYYEEDTSLSERLRGLDRYGKLNFYPKLLKATLELKNGMIAEANQTLREFEYVVKNGDQAKFIEKYHSGIATILYPYCKANQFRACEAYASRYANKAFRKF